MRKLKIILQSKILYSILILTIFIQVIFTSFFVKQKSIYIDGFCELNAEIKSYQYLDDKLVLELFTSEKIKATYYLKEKENIPVHIGDIVNISGTMSSPTENTIPNTFNYKKYLENNQIYKIIKIDRIKVIKKSSNPFVKVKDFIYQRARKHEYLLLFICGDKSGLDKEAYSSYKDIGIAHLLAISGMHVSIFIAILNKLLFFLSDNKRKPVIIFFLLFYTYIVNFSPSILRVVIFYIWGFIFKKVNIKVSNLQRLLLTAFVIISINPYNIYSVSFQFSFLASLAIILTTKYQKKNYFLNIIIISFWTLMFSLPVSVNMNYEINLISFFSNLLFIPYVSFFLYPLSLICFIFPFMLGSFSFFIRLMEKTGQLLNNVHIFTINIPKLSFIIIILFYIFLLLYLYFHQKRYFILIILLLVINKTIPYLDSNEYVIFFDVGQGDCSVLISKHQQNIVMIDTGGKENTHVSDNVILYLKSRGITKIDTLVITHGDFDHGGDAFNVIEKMRVNSIMLNNGEDNDLEKKIKSINIPLVKGFFFDNKIYNNLNKKIFANENDNSIVLNINILNHNFLFMGDASRETEKEILDKYNLPNIAVLKTGHHGSKTSSGKEFINIVNPQYSIISVGKNNRYHHPNKEVLDTLNNSIIYRTDINGSIIFKIKKDKLDIKACPP